MKNIFKTFFNSTHTEAPASPQKLFSFTNTIRTACSALLLAAATFVGAGSAWAIDAPNPSDAHQTLTQNGHTIDVYSYVENGNEYTLFITSTENLTGLGGSFWYINGNNTDDLRNNLTGKGTTMLTRKVTSTSAPQLYTSLFVLFPDEANFGSFTLDWIAPGNAENAGSSSSPVINDYILPDQITSSETSSCDYEGGNTHANACDGNVGSRWASLQSVGNDAWWQVKYNAPVSFDAIEIVWENAYGKSFDILGSNDGVNWSTILTIRNQNLGNFPNTQRYSLDDTVIYQYVKFQGVERATGYGYSFFEFSVLRVYPDVEYTASSHVTSDQNNIAANGADGDENTRWESAYSDPQWWQVDFQKQKTFDQINILWNECYARDLKILATNDPTVAAQNPTNVGDWTTLVSFDDLVLTSFENTRTWQQINLDESVSYRYVRVLGTERAPAGNHEYYGYSFYEFNAQATAPRVAKLTLNSTATNFYPTQTATLSVSAIDQFGNAITPNVTYSVDPASAGTFEGNVFTAAEIGNAVITATDASGVKATMNIEIVAHNPKIQHLVLEAEKYEVVEEAEFVLSLKGVDQYGEEYAMTEEEFNLSFTTNPTGIVEQLSGFNFRALEAGHTTVTVTATPKTSSSRRAPALNEPSLSDNVEITVTAKYPNILKDYKDFTFQHTQGAYYWLGDAYGTFNDTYYYAPTDETRPYVDTRFLENGDPEGRMDPRIAVGGGVRQRTHTLDHTVWAMPGEEVYLYPFSDFATQTRYSEEFIHWYDYATDRAVEGLSFPEKHYYSPNFGVISGKGWIEGRPDGTPAPFATVAHYTAPSYFATNPDARVFIACDLSQTGVKLEYQAPETDTDDTIWDPYANGGWAWNGGGNAAIQTNNGEHTITYNAPSGNHWDWNNQYKFVLSDVSMYPTAGYTFSCDVEFVNNVGSFSINLEDDSDNNNALFKEHYVTESGHVEISGNDLTKILTRPALIFFVSPAGGGNLQFKVKNIKLVRTSKPDASTTPKVTVDKSVGVNTIYEPIIHGRQLFTVRPAAYIADQLSNHNADYINSVRRKISARAGVRFNVRLEYEMPVAKNVKSPLYYMNGGNVDHVYGYAIETYKKENGALTRVGDIFKGDAGTYVDAKFDPLMHGIDGNDFYRGIMCAATDANIGVYVVKIIGCDASGNKLSTLGGQDLEVMEYEITFLGEDNASFLTEAVEATRAADTNDPIYYHTEEYLQQRAQYDFTQAAVVTFDDYAESQFIPMQHTDYQGNYYKWPVPWYGCTYMFGFDRQRRDAAGNYINDFNMYMLAKHSSTVPCNTAANAYTDALYADATGQDARQNTGSPMGAFGLYDRTFYTTGKMGNFFFVNASSDPGKMVDAQIDDLCLGSTLYVSAWVAEMSNKNQWGGNGESGNPAVKPSPNDGWEPCSETANLIFNFNAVKKNGSKVTLHSFTTGYVDRGNGYSSYMQWKHGDGPQIGNVRVGTIADYDWNHDVRQGDGQQGQWMHVYYTFVPDAHNVSTDEIDHYEIALENNCISSDGADYAIDDIRVFVSRPEVKAEQLVPLCTKDDKDTEIKISANFDTMISSLGLTEAKASKDDAAANEEDKAKKVDFYYTILDKEKYYNSTKTGTERLKESVLHYKYLTENPDHTVTDPDLQGFGKGSFWTYFSDNNTYEGASPEPSAGGTDTWREEDLYGTRYLVFNTHPTDGDMIPGKEYIIVIYAPPFGKVDKEKENENYLLDANLFPVDDLCAKRCVFRVHSSGVIKVNGKIVNDQDAVLVCENQTPVVQIDAKGKVPVNPGHKIEVIEENAVYDWYNGTMADFLAEKKADLSLSDALTHYREAYPEGNDCSRPAIDSYTEADRAYLMEATAMPTNGGTPKVSLYQSSMALMPGMMTVQDGVKEYYVVAVPIARDHYIVNDVTYEVGTGEGQILVCTDPTEIHIRVAATSPRLLHGFPEGQTYPEGMDDVPLRIGLDQLDQRTRATVENLKEIAHYYSDNTYAAGQTVENAVKSGMILNIPIRRVTPTQSVLTTLKRVDDDPVIYLVETNDEEYSKLSPTASEAIMGVPAIEGTPADEVVLLPQVGVLLGLTADTRTKDVNMMRMAFRDDFNFKEGYYYRFLFHYTEDYPELYEGQRTDCVGQLVFTLKIVPKYQKWTGAVSDDYNNDLNWSRVTSEELYAAKADADADGAKRKKVTDGANSNTYSYVPMDFTDVLIPSVENAPILYSIAPVRNMKVAEGGTANGGTDAGYDWPMGSNEEGQTAAMHSATATPFIEYDMAAWNSNLGVNCRPWYANTCEYVTFNPDAEMLNQQNLVYQKAWVEIEIAKDRWYTLASPFSETVAGDMYLPTAGNEPARQVTEHFLPITFDNTLVMNDRFRPAVYQRSWDHKGQATVYRMDRDGLKDGIYDAAVRANWSHVYNDVDEHYSTGTGYSIKADVSRLAKPEEVSNVLFRLPKDDYNYIYYALDKTTDQRNKNVRSERDVFAIPGNVVPNYRLNEFTVASGDSTIVSTVNVQTAGKYFLVGNPFMAHLDMDKFLEANKNTINGKYWILKSGLQQVSVRDDNGWIPTGGAESAGSVAPLQGFFVEAKEYAEALSFTFTPEMMKLDRISPTNNGNRLQAPASRSSVEQSGVLQMTLSDGDELISAAALRLCGTADNAYRDDEDAILLLDSNLDEQAAIYTVAGETAVSINTLSEIKAVPLGVVCHDDEAAQHPVTLRISGADNFAQTLYLYNAATDEATLITDDFSMLIPARSAGQYFITTGLEEIEEEISAAGPVYNLKGIRVANTRNERVLIQDGRKSIAH